MEHVSRPTKSRCITQKESVNHSSNLQPLVSVVQAKAQARLHVVTTPNRRLTGASLSIRLLRRLFEDANNRP